MQLTGQAIVKGLAGGATYTGLGATSTQKMTGADFTDDAETKQFIHSSTTGKPVTIFVSRKKRELSLDFYPASVDTDGNRTNANAVAALVLPAIPSAVTLASFEDSTMNGSWIYMGGGKKSLTEDGLAKMTLPIVQYPDLSAGEFTDLLTAVS